MRGRIHRGFLTAAGLDMVRKLLEDSGWRLNMQTTAEIAVYLDVPLEQADRICVLLGLVRMPGAVGLALDFGGPQDGRLQYSYDDADDLECNDNR